MANRKSPPLPLIHEAAALHRAGRLAEASALYQKVLKKNPRDPDALHLLGLATAQQGDLRGGLDMIKKGLQVRDDFPDAHSNAANLAAQLGDFSLAEHHARRVTAYRKNAAAYTMLGRLLRTQEKYDEALQAFRAAHECNPRDVEGYVAYGLGLRMTADQATMLAISEAGLKIAPDHPPLQIWACEANFGLGRLKEGWHSYRARFRALENRVPMKPYHTPIWQGEDLTGQRLLIWAEQAPGDEIMYANMYADAIARAKSVAIQCSPRLATVMRRSFPSAEIFDRDLTAAELQNFDFQSPAASLGEWFRTERESFPATSGYLKPDSELRDQLRANYLGANKNRVLVGIAWRSVNTINAADKSVSVLHWGPILKVPGVVFVNLQYGDVAFEVNEASKGFGTQILQDSSIDPLKDMDSYIAQVAAMDMVVSTSNTAAHVAGALGVPTVCMLPASLDHGRRWYWLAEYGRTPWYPSLQLVIQNKPGDWFDVIRDAGLAVLDFTTARHPAPTADYYRAMITGFLSMKRPQNAERVCEHMARDPNLAAEAYHCIADLRKSALDAPGVFAACEKSIKADPTYWQSYNLIGVTLSDLHRFDEGISAYLQALALNPRSHMVHGNIAKAYHQLGRYDEAIKHYREALECIPPEKISAIDNITVNYALVLHDSGEVELARELLEDIIERAPEIIEAHYNLALLLLSQEEWRRGWQEYGWRLKRPNTVVSYDTFAHLKRWNGEVLAGKKILIWCEHGIGDEILASTMIPDAIAAARKIVILCSDRLVPIFRRSFPRAQVDAFSTPLPKSAMATDFDYQIGVWDLGRAFRPDRTSFTPKSGHLVHDAKRSATLRQKYADLRPGNLIVGISWASPINQEMGWLKASRLESWKPILSVPGVTFINLQYGDQRATLESIKDEMGIDIVNDPDVDPLKDMDAYASQVAAMDLVISTSNTLVHTAGAIGTPTWVLLARGRGQIWYWLNDRADSVWYSSIRLVRQQIAGDWTHPIAQCARDLHQLAQEKKAREPS